MLYLQEKNSVNEVNCDNIDFLERKISGKEGLLIDVREFIADLGEFIDSKLVKATAEEKDIIRDHIEMTILALANSNLRPRREGSIEDARPPVRSLSDEEIEEIRTIGAAHPWAERRRDDTRSPVQWVVDHYGKYIPGLLQSHIGQADAKLYPAFAKHISRGKLPDALDIPTAAENKLRATPLSERGALRIGRKWQAASKRTYRAGKCALGE